MAATAAACLEPLVGCNSPSFAVTVAPLSGECLCIDNLSAADPLRLLVQRVSAALSIPEAMQLRLFAGERALTAELMSESLGALGVCEGSQLTCVRSWPERVFQDAGTAFRCETLRLRLGSDFRCMLTSSSVAPLLMEQWKSEPDRYTAACGTYRVEGHVAVCSWEQQWGGVLRPKAGGRTQWRQFSAALLPTTFDLQNGRWAEVDDPDIKCHDTLGVCLPDWPGFV